MTRPIRLVSGPEARCVRRAYAAMLPIGAGLEPHLHGVLADTLAHPGNLTRAQLAYGIGRRRGVPPARAIRLAVAVEYFHAASLIFDDMPSMDGAASRRGRPCPHLVYGEAAAALGALALITRGYDLLWRAIEGLPAPTRARAAALVAGCLGPRGILDGQARDVHFRRRGSRERDILHIAAAKTVPLVRLAVVLPAIVAGERARTVSRLERLARSWGLAYQVLDDFKDVLLSEAEAGKTTARDGDLGRPNLPSWSGPARALGRLDGLLEDARRDVAKLGRVDASAWRPLIGLQRSLEAAREQVVRRLPRRIAA